MEIPDWDDYSRLESKVKETSEVVYDLAEALGKVKWRVGEDVFESRSQAEKRAAEIHSKQLEEILSINSTGCVPYPEIQRIIA